MVDRGIKRHSEIWVENQYLVQKVDGFGWSSGVLAGQVYSAAVGERLQVLQGFLVRDETLVVIVRRSDEVKDDG